MTSIGDSAFSVWPSEHGCFRVADAADRDRLDAAFVRAGQRRGPMVVYLCAESAQDETSTRLRGLDDALDEHFDGPRRLDLADLSYVDVSGMRALRGRSGQPLTLAGASAPVLRLVDPLGWDTDPTVEVAA